MQDKIKAAVIGSFIGDSLALGVHWVYNPEDIVNKYGTVDTLLKPELVDYHAGKEAGDLTHYGDQAFELLISISTANGFDVDNFMNRWRMLMRNGYTGYIDHASKITLDQQFGECETTASTACVSTSSDLGGASRIAPLLVTYAHNPEALRDAAIDQTRLTHNNPKVLEAAAFFAEVVHEVIDGKSPRHAMESVLSGGEGRFGNIKGLVRSGLDSTDQDTGKAVADFGMSCDIDGALPSTVHIISKFENNFQKALTENVMAGGDSAARGMLIGMVIGAQSGMNGIPAGWFDGLKRHEELDGYISQTLHKHYYDYTVEESY
jgi:ADP-ribosylglycohydrolase